MTNEERRVRFKVACEIADRVFTDMCRADNDTVPKEVTDEFKDLLITMAQFSETLKVKLK